MDLSRVNIAKEHVSKLEPAPIPEPGFVLQTRTGKKQALGPYESAIAKQQIEEPIFATHAGLDGDEHCFRFHGGTDRAVHQYNANHYADWRAERPPKPGLFDVGGFGENLTTTNMNEENVCVGDLYRLGERVLLQVSEPRNPCYKLNIRFSWPRALKRIQRTGRVGWNFRVLRTGYIKKGDIISLVERPHPQWSVMNVQRAIQAKSVPLQLLEECSELEVLTDKFRGLALRRLEAASKRYKVVSVEAITHRVKQFTFALHEPLKLISPAFQPYAFAQIRFDRNLSISRAYSIVSGDLRTFCIGVALDEKSRGGSEYLHRHLNVGDEVEMVPGASPRAVANEETCEQEQSVKHRLVIIGGIGVTAFLPAMRQWQKESLPFEVHYAVRSGEEAAYASDLRTKATRIYSSACDTRMDVSNLVPPAYAGTKIYCCGPVRLMQQCRQRTTELAYPEHMLYFEDFTAPPSNSLGKSFEVEVHEPDTGRQETLSVSADKTLLQVLKEAGFDDIMSSCETGGCGACKVTLCQGKVEFKSIVLTDQEKKTSLQSCVDRGVGKIQIEID